MAHAEKCPVCSGTGKSEPDKVCHGCDGKGWVTVKDDDSGNWTYPVPYPQWPWYDPYRPTYPYYTVTWACGNTK